MKLYAIPLSIIILLTIVSATSISDNYYSNSNDNSYYTYSYDNSDCIIEKQLMVYSAPEVRHVQQEYVQGCKSCQITKTLNVDYAPEVRHVQQETVRTCKLCVFRNIFYSD